MERKRLKKSNEVELLFEKNVYKNRNVPELTMYKVERFTRFFLDTILNYSVCMKERHE